ncbi:MAG: BMP family ABC transporter substrate-binding protein [Proteobacteria bacterium]|nr:BMP family ABC transporter substrate-binding protein [Pseudomonadota bacterium]
MRNRSLVLTLLVAISLAVAMAACKKDEQLKFVYISPDPIGVNPFLAMGKSGLEESAQSHGAIAKTFQSEDPTTRRENLRAAVAEGAKIVVVIGFQFNDMINEFAEKHPNVQFLIVDQCVEKRPHNLHCAEFREHEATFLLGAEAASLTKSGHVGVVCALDIPFMHRFTDGFTLGAKHVKSDIKVDVRWVGGQNPYSDPVRAKEHAIALHAAGADIIFAATSAGDYGIFEAAVEKGFKVMGVDINHCPNAPGKMYDSALKRIDVAMTETIKRIMAGEKKISASYGLKEGGATVMALKRRGGLSSTKCLIADESEVVRAVRDLKDQIVSGKIKIPDPKFAKK